MSVCFSTLLWIYNWSMSSVQVWLLPNASLCYSAMLFDCGMWAWTYGHIRQAHTLCVTKPITEIAKLIRHGCVSNAQETDHRARGARYLKHEDLMMIIIVCETFDVDLVFLQMLKSINAIRYSDPCSCMLALRASSEQFLMSFTLRRALTVYSSLSACISSI